MCTGRALKARISTDYGLTIAGQKISATNNAATGITGTGITGKVTYNPSTKTLTLDNATIEYEQGAAIVWESTEALTVDLVGNSKRIPSIQVLPKCQMLLPI